MMEGHPSTYPHKIDTCPANDEDHVQENDAQTSQSPYKQHNRQSNTESRKVQEPKRNLDACEQPRDRKKSKMHRCRGCFSYLLPQPPLHERLPLIHGPPPSWPPLDEQPLWPQAPSLRHKGRQTNEREGVSSHLMDLEENAIRDQESLKRPQSQLAG